MGNRFALGIDGGASKVLTQLFTINKNNEIIKRCKIISRGTTVQISEQVILEEYNFVGRSISLQSEK